MLLKSVYLYFRRTLVAIAWRRNNKHNSTRMQNGKMAYLDCVKVGNFTYGPLNVQDADTGSRLIIGNYCSIASNVTFILGNDHPLNYISTYPFKVLICGEENEAISHGDIVIDDDVWIGHGATILSGVHIGQGACVAAGAVVSSDVEPYAVVGGVPAKLIKYRFAPEIIDELLKVDYSKLDPSLVKNNINALYETLVSKEQIEWLPKINSTNSSGTLK